MPGKVTIAGHLPLDLAAGVAAAATLPETAALMRTALEMHLQAMREDGDAIPEPTTAADFIAVPA